MDGMIARRRLLLGTVVGGGGLVALVRTRPAGAFTTESIEPGSSVGLAYADRCKSDAPEHAQIRTVLRNRLAGEVAPPGATVSASEACPLCGCPISVTRQVD